MFSKRSYDISDTAKDIIYYYYLQQTQFITIKMGYNKK